MQFRGYSVSVGDFAAGAVSAVGLILAIFSGRYFGGLVLDATGSLWLGTCTWVATILVGVIMFFGGAAFVLRASRTYRHPEPRHRFNGKHQFEGWTPLVEPGISDVDGGQWARCRVVCAHCGDERAVWKGVDPKMLETVTECPGRPADDLPERYLYT